MTSWGGRESPTHRRGGHCMACLSMRTTRARRYDRFAYVSVRMDRTELYKIKLTSPKLDTTTALCNLSAEGPPTVGTPSGVEVGCQGDWTAHIVSLAPVLSRLHFFSHCVRRVT